jgi:hypothetical protein
MVQKNQIVVKRVFGFLKFIFSKMGDSQMVPTQVYNSKVWYFSSTYKNTDSVFEHTTKLSLFI